MAYMDKERKTQLAPGVRAVLSKYKVKGTLSTDRNSITLTLRSGPIDFIANYNATCDCYYNGRIGWVPITKGNLHVNTHHVVKSFSGDALLFLQEVIAALNTGNHDNSDIQSDYFDVGWYVSVDVGKWNNAYIVN